MPKHGVLAILFVCLLGCSPVAPSRTPEGAARYVIVQVSSPENETLMVDSATGRTWELVERADHGKWWAQLLIADDANHGTQVRPNP